MHVEPAHVIRSMAEPTAIIMQRLMWPYDGISIALNSPQGCSFFPISCWVLVKCGTLVQHIIQDREILPLGPVLSKRSHVYRNTVLLRFGCSLELYYWFTALELVCLKYNLDFALNDFLCPVMALGYKGITEHWSVLHIHADWACGEARLDLVSIVRTFGHLEV